MVPHTNIILSIIAILLVCSLTKRIQEAEIAVTLAAEGISNVSFAGAAEQNNIQLSTNSSDELQGSGEIGTAGNCAYECKMRGYSAGGECQTTSCDIVLTDGPVSSTNCWPRVCCCFKTRGHLAAHADIQAGDPRHMVKKSDLDANRAARAIEAERMPNPLRTAGDAVKAGGNLIGGVLSLPGRVFEANKPLGPENFDIVSGEQQYFPKYPEPQYRKERLTKEFMEELRKKDQRAFLAYLSRRTFQTGGRPILEQTLEQVPEAAEWRKQLDELQQQTKRDLERAAPFMPV